MTFNLTLTGENPQELANFLTALATINGTTHATTQTLVSNGKAAQLPASAAADFAAADNVAGSSNGAAQVPAKATSAAAKKAVVQRKAAAKAEAQAATIPADEDAIDGFSAGIENAAAGDDYDFGLDLGTKTSGWTVEEVREKAKEVVNAGKQLQLRECLSQFGAASISTLDSQYYDDFMAAINKIGR